MNTKELFELAKIASDTEDLFLQHDHEDYRIAEWEDQHPHEQAAKAEAIRAVIEELVSRGWGYYPQRFVLGVDPSAPFVPYVDENTLTDQSTDPLPRTLKTIQDLSEAFAKITATPPSAGNTKPRVWDRIEDVPAFVVVTDRDHDFWKIDDDGDTFLKCSDENGFRRINDSYEEINYFKPFTEVIEPDTWDRWEDVPENVWVESVPNGTRYINRNGVRHVGWDDGTDEKHQFSTEWLNTYRAPFKRVG